MANGELTQQTQEDDIGGRRAVVTVDGAAGFAVWITDADVGPPGSVTLDGAVPAGEPLPAGVFHLVIADVDLAHRALQSHTTLCGAEMQPKDLPSSWLDDQVDPRYCPECAREALRAAAGDAASARR